MPWRAHDSIYTHAPNRASGIEGGQNVSSRRTAPRRVVIRKFSDLAFGAGLDLLPCYRWRLPVDGASRSFAWRARLFAVATLPVDAFVHASWPRRSFRS